MKNYFKKSGSAKLGAKTQRLCLLIAMVGFISINSVSAQNDDVKKGFIGISLGAAIPMGSFIADNCNTGGQFNIDFGYLFAKNIGMHAQLFGTMFYSKYQTDNSIGLAGLQVGPLFSTSSTGVLEFDFKPSIGFARGSLFEGYSESSRSEITFSFGATASIRWNCWRNFSLSSSVMYIYGKPEGIDLSSIGIMIGANYRLR